MKHINHIAWVLLASVILLSLFRGQGFLSLNYFSLQVVKASFSHAVDKSNSVTQVSSMDDPRLNCHLRWFELLLKYRQQPVDPDDPIFGEVISCSSVHMRMLRRLYPAELALANLATQLYPDETAPLYWLVEATDPTISNESKPVIQKILTMTPNDGLAWRYLGIILIREGDIQGAIDAHINSCYNGDPGSNGCYNAGRLLEQEGRYEEAISFYRLSIHDFIRANADRLEDLLAGSQ